MLSIFKEQCSITLAAFSSELELNIEASAGFTVLSGLHMQLIQHQSWIETYYVPFMQKAPEKSPDRL